MRVVPVVPENLVSEHTLAAPRESRVPAFDRLLYLQARVQAQVFRSGIRGLYGIILRIAIGSGHEQAVFVYTWRSESRASHFGRPQERKQAITPQSQ